MKAKDPNLQEKVYAMILTKKHLLSSREIDDLKEHDYSSEQLDLLSLSCELEQIHRRQRYPYLNIW